MNRCAISAALKFAFGKQKQRAPFSRIAWISAGRRLIAKSFMNAISPGERTPRSTSRRRPVRPPAPVVLGQCH